MRRGKLGFWLRFAIVVLKPVLTVLTRREWRGMHNIPRTGGAVLCGNHISHVDPLVFAHFVYDAGRAPRFLAKAALFRVPFVGRVVRGAGQIPVYRESGSAARAYADAEAAVRRGEAVCIYPEATITRDPGLWPMTGKTGAARIALSTGAPVIPIAQWGAHELLPPYSARPHLFPRRVMRIAAGPPVDLDDLQGRELTADVLRIATERILDAIAQLLSDIRGEPAPDVRFDARTAGLPLTGDPRRSGSPARPDQGSGGGRRRPGRRRGSA